MAKWLDDEEEEKKPIDLFYFNKGDVSKWKGKSNESRKNIYDNGEEGEFNSRQQRLPPIQQNKPFNPNPLNLKYTAPEKDFNYSPVFNKNKPIAFNQTPLNKPIINNPLGNLNSDANKKPMNWNPLNLRRIVDNSSSTLDDRNIMNQIYKQGSKEAEQNIIDNINQGYKNNSLADRLLKQSQVKWIENVGGDVARDINTNQVVSSKNFDNGLVGNFATDIVSQALNPLNYLGFGVGGKVSNLATSKMKAPVGKWVSDKVIQGAIGGAIGNSNSNESNLTRDALTGAVLNTGFSALGVGAKKGFNKLLNNSTDNLNIGSLETTQAPTPPTGGKYTVNNDRNVLKAQQEYEQLVTDIQNKFGTNKLTQQELDTVLPQLQQKLDALNNTKTDIRAIGERAKMGQIADVNSFIKNPYASDIIPQPRPLNPLQATGTLNKPIDLVPPILKNNNTKVKSNVKNLNVFSANDKQLASELSTKIDGSASTIQNIPPQKGSGIYKESKLKTNTFTKMLDNSKEHQDLLKTVNSTYETKPNIQSIDRATEMINKDYVGTKKRLMSIGKDIEKNNSGSFTAEDSVANGLITKHMLNTKDYKGVKEFIENTQPKYTEAGQMLQALKTWKDLTPESTLMKAQQAVASINREGKKADIRFKPVELTEADIKFISETMKKVANMPDTKGLNVFNKNIEKEQLFNKVKSVIANKAPSSTWDKINAYRHFSLLGNAKTQVRNVTSNALFSGAENIKDLLATPLDKLVSMKTGYRTTGIPNLKQQGKGFVQGTKEGWADLKSFKKHGRDKFDIPPQEVFNANTKVGRFMNKLDATTGNMLGMGDKPFYEAHRQNALHNLMKLNKVAEPTEKMVLEAHEIALDKTFQNSSYSSETIKKFKDMLNAPTNNFNKLLGGKVPIGDLLVPFTKTPGNILSKATDYTPLGILKSGLELNKAKKGTFNQKKFVDQLSRGITGTALGGVGYGLANSGKITGKQDEDKDKAQFDKMTGKLPYSIKVGDKNYTYDFLQPLAMPIQVGANAKKGIKASDISDSVLDAMGTVQEQSMLKGINDMISGRGSFAEKGTEALLKTGGQFVPSALKQIATATDDNKRNISGNVDVLKNGIPIVNKTLPKKYDTLGREVKNVSPLNTFFNPLNIGKAKQNKTEQFINDKFNYFKNQDGANTIFPQVAPKKFNYKVSKNESNTLNMNPSEQSEYQKKYGAKLVELYEKLERNTQFNNLDKEEQIKEMQDAQKESNSYAKDSILKSKKIIIPKFDTKQTETEKNNAKTRKQIKKDLYNIFK